MNFSY